MYIPSLKWLLKLLIVLCGIIEFESSLCVLGSRLLSDKWFANIFFFLPVWSCFSFLKQCFFWRAEILMKSFTNLFSLCLCVCLRNICLHQGHKGFLLCFLLEVLEFKLRLLKTNSLFNFKNWSIIDLHHYASSRCTTQWFNISILYKIIISVPNCLWELRSKFIEISPSLFLQRSAFPTSGTRRHLVHDDGDPPDVRRKRPSSAGEDRAMLLGLAVMGFSVLMFFVLGVTILKPFLLRWEQREET